MPKRGVSQKTHPHLWEKAKKMACEKSGLCDHSARKMQLATHYYKKMGGKYVGPKKTNNSLIKWGREKWRTETGKESEGRRRYLPDKVWKSLTADQRRRTNNAKRIGTTKTGKQWIQQPEDVAKKASEIRKRLR